MSSRANLEAMTRQRAATAALSKEDYVAAERYARRLRVSCNAPPSSIRCCRRSKNGEDIARVVDILTDAEQAFGKAEDGVDKARAMLILAGAAARTDRLRGFDILSSAIAAINHADPDNRSHRATQEGDLDPETLSFDQVFTMLARTDFDRVVQLAQSIDKKEFSVLAQLAICRGVLTQTRTGHEEEA